LAGEKRGRCQGGGWGLRRRRDWGFSAGAGGGSTPQ
jgi:hypothetical protein